MIISDENKMIVEDIKETTNILRSKMDILRNKYDKDNKVCSEDCPLCNVNNCDSIYNILDIEYNDEMEEYY